MSRQGAGKSSCALFYKQTQRNVTCCLPIICHCENSACFIIIIKTKTARNPTLYCEVEELLFSQTQLHNLCTSWHQLHSLVFLNTGENGQRPQWLQAALQLLLMAFLSQVKGFEAVVRHSHFHMRCQTLFASPIVQRGDFCGRGSFSLDSPTDSAKCHK